jgi:magnesium-transporting ATPase (P-type)
MIRSCVRHKLSFEKGDESTELPNSETVDALKPLINSFNSTLIPFLVCYCFDTHTKTFVMRFIYASTVLNAMIAVMLMFAHWQKGPRLYKKYAPYVFFVSIIFTYVISPVLIVILLAIQLVKIEKYRYYSAVYLMYFAWVYCFRLGEFFSRIKPVLIEMRKTVDINSELESLSKDDLKEDLLRNMEKLEDSPSEETRLRIKLIKIQLQEKVGYR